MLQEEIRNDIIESIKANLQFGNITADDANQLQKKGINRKELSDMFREFCIVIK